MNSANLLIEEWESLELQLIILNSLAFAFGVKPSYSQSFVQPVLLHISHSYWHISSSVSPFFSRERKADRDMLWSIQTHCRPSTRSPPCCSAPASCSSWSDGYSTCKAAWTASLSLRFRLWDTQQTWHFPLTMCLCWIYHTSNLVWVYEELIFTGPHTLSILTTRPLRNSKIPCFLPLFFLQGVWASALLPKSQNFTLLSSIEVVYH